MIYIVRITEVHNDILPFVWQLKRLQLAEKSLYHSYVCTVLFYHFYYLPFFGTLRMSY